MKKRDDTCGMSRRDFLRTFGMVTGAVAAFPLQAQARFFWNGSIPLRIGVVIPSSVSHPMQGENLVAGMKLRLSQAGWNDTKLLVEQADTGSAVAKAVKLLRSDQVDVLTGILNPRLVPSLREELEKTGTIFINVEGGANAFVPRDESPFVFHNSLGYWQANWAMGAWAAANMGKRAFAAASFYETGYDAYYSFPQGFRAAGGAIIASEVTHLTQQDLASLMTAIRKARPDFVYAAYSGRDAAEFVRAYHKAGLTGRIPLVASGFAVDEALLADLGEAAIGIRSCLSWAPGLETPDNQAFRSAFLHSAGRAADPFAVLGYDTAGMIGEAVRTAAGKLHRPEELKKALEATRIASPRGALRIDPLTGNADAPLYLREVRMVGGVPRNAVMAELPGLAAVERRADRPAMEAKSGWINTYLCA